MEKFSKNVLIFPSGIENGLEIHKSLKYCKEINIFSATADVPNQAFFIYKENNIIPDVRTGDWITELNKAISKNNIDLVYPANSIIIDSLSENRDRINADILLPDHSIIDLTRSKKRTIARLESIILTPKVFLTKESVFNFPVFVKPDRGYGSQGARVVNSHAELDSIPFDDFIVQELLPGREFTIDCFSDKNCSLLFSGGRERSRVRMGTSMHAEIVTKDLEDQFELMASKILKEIPISGAWFFQVKEDVKGRFKLLEIDIRIAGTMGFNRCRGINFPMLSIFQHYGYSVSTFTNNVHIKLDRCLRNRYLFDYDYDTVYIDLDDTIIVHEKINLEVIQFIYQCINKKIKLILISKSLAEDKEDFLAKWRVQNLFDEKIWLEEKDPKYKYMKHENAIYIDDSFSQRLEVHNKRGIPTFDCSMVESLIDDRN